MSVRPGRAARARAVLAGGLAAPGPAVAQAWAGQGRSCTGGMTEGMVPHRTIRCVACRAPDQTGVFRCVDGHWTLTQQYVPHERAEGCGR